MSLCFRPNMQPIRNFYVNSIMIGYNKYKNLKHTGLANFAKKAVMSVKINSPDRALIYNLLNLDWGRRLHLGQKNSLVLLLDYNAHQALQYIIPNISKGARK